ncbi:hypothetical protein WA845_17615 [Agrobacterium sp. CMT1]|uniref:hypothetical protein n=1 Tax=Agrobacterium sp. CMT1 TaxID=3128901 RepID=UPI0030776EF8
MTNKSFKKGFVDGFTAPFTFLVTKPKSTERYHISVDKAWKDVGDAFFDVMKEQGAISGERRNQKGRGPKQAA